MTFLLRKDSVICQKHNNDGAPQCAVKELHSQPPGNADNTIQERQDLFSFRLCLRILVLDLAALTMLLRIVLGFGVVICLHLARVTTAVSVVLVRMVLVRMVRAALGAFLAAFGALFAAAIGFVLTRTLSATLRAFGATRFGFLVLIGLRRALGHRDCESGQQEGQQHNEYSALSGFHFLSPRQMMITVRPPAHTRSFRVRLWRVNRFAGRFLNTKNAAAKISRAAVRNQRSDDMLREFAVARCKSQLSASALC